MRNVADAMAMWLSILRKVCFVLFTLGLFTLSILYVEIKKMFSDLNNLLNIDISNLPRGQCILAVEISGSNGSFILHHFLSLALRGGTAVCFVGLAQTFNHYACIGNKLTLNLSRMRESGKLTFIDALSSNGNDFVKYCVTSTLPRLRGNKAMKQLCPFWYITVSIRVLR